MLSIRWRPSGGRGEYEYIARNLDVLGKYIAIQVPALGSVIETDVTFRIKDGKPRLRRDNPNDRSLLNVPPLVAAISGLPAPRREDQQGRVSYPLSKKSYVVDEVLFEIVHMEASVVIAKPVLMKPRNADSYIDVEARVEELLSRSDEPPIEHWRIILEAGVNSAGSLSAAGENAHEAMPYVDVLIDDFDATSSKADELDQIIEEYTGNEGKVRIRIHRHKERDAKLVRLAKKKFRLTYAKLFCECCGIDFEEIYGMLGKDFMEAHHRVPLSTLEENAITAIDDLAMLCSNCHRMVHRTDSCTIEEVRDALRASGYVFSTANLNLLLTSD